MNIVIVGNHAIQTNITLIYNTGESMLAHTKIQPDEKIRFQNIYLI